ncbi:LysR family transcriptional regulator [Burkholderiales bacterium 8X]|nr:LysR family transcriptional regulator [Burkholderiales bacterium 8X]
MNISLRQIEVFLAVADTLSFSKAARQCHLSQPALSANVKRLEAVLEARLFDRHTRKVSLTAVGREFLQVAKTLTENMNASLERVQDFVAGKRGRLVVAAAPSMAASFVPEVIAAFSKLHPNVDVRLHDELSDVCIQMLRSGSADVAIAPQTPNTQDLQQVALFRDHLGVICRSDHPLALPSAVGWRAIQPFAHVVMNKDSGVRQFVDAQYARHGVRLRPAFEVTHVGTMLGLIAANLAIGELPESLLQNIDMTGLAFRRISSAAAYRTICAVTLRASSPTPAVAPFMTICKQFAALRVAAPLVHLPT